MKLEPTTHKRRDLQIADRGTPHPHTMTCHPPLENGEKFIGNVTATDLPAHLHHIQGFRFATPAYDIFGDVINGYYAMIANPSALEQYCRIMEDRLSAIKQGRNPQKEQAQ